MLVDATTDNKLTINKILDITEQDETILYSLKHSKEKIHLWLADNLMPGTAKILFANVFDPEKNIFFSIATIDYMFFWVCNQQAMLVNSSNYKVDYNNYTSLRLPHINKIDFINFPDINSNDNFFLNDRLKKLEVSIALAVQALLQTDNIIEIINFFVKNEIKYLPLLTNKIYRILFDKLANKDLFCNFNHDDFLTASVTVSQIKYLLAFALANNQTAIIIKCFAFIRDNNDINNTEKLEIIQARLGDYNNTSGLYLALQNSNSVVVSEYIKLVFSYNKFTTEQKQRLYYYLLA